MLDKQTYSKSPSWYLPKAWRMTVLIAMRGFTTQNCRVAYRNERGGMRRQDVQEAKFPNQNHDGVSTGTTQQGNTIQHQQGVWPCHLLTDHAWGLQHPKGDKGDSEEVCVLSTCPEWKEKPLCRLLLEAAKLLSSRAVFHRLYCSTFMQGNSMKTKKSHTVLWYGHGKFNKAILGKGSKLQSTVAIKLGKKVACIEGEPSSLRRNFDNCHHIKAFCIHNNVCCETKVKSHTRPLLNLPKGSVALGISSIHSASIYHCSYWDDSCQSHPILHLSGDVELQGPKRVEGYDPKNVTHVSLKEAGRAQAGADLCACGEGCVWKEGKTKQE